MAEVPGSGIPTGQVPANAILRRVANQLISTSTTTDISWDTEDEDNGACHSLVTNPERFTAPVAGLYDFWCVVLYAANATGDRLLIPLKNGASVVRYVRAPANSTNDAGYSIAWSHRLVAGDYVTLGAQQNSGGDLNLTAAFGGTLRGGV